MHAVPLALRRDPLDVLARLAAEPGTVLLEVPDPVRPLVLVGCRPATRLEVRGDGIVERDGAPLPACDPLAALTEFVAASGDGPALPFPLGANVVGVLGYELGRVIEPSIGGGPSSDLPLAVLLRYDTLLAFDRVRLQWLLLSAERRPAPVAWLDRLLDDRVAGADADAWPPGLAATPLEPCLPTARYLAAVDRIRRYLAAGDVYQVNLTQPYETRLVAPPWAVYARLARRHPVPYGAYLDLGDTQLIVNSPELFLRRRGARVVTCPIKGTRPRGSSALEDVARAAELRRDPKERAEHVMIVDLERSDLGRVSTPGSVVVESFAAVESHPTVHHLVSTVAGRLRDGVGLAELLRATFPGGSITGAPKVRAMEIIRELEPWARGPYTGALGLFHPGGDLELALAIRTAVVRDQRLRYHAGGGIVIDSVPAREHDEAWLKTAALRIALGEDEAQVAWCSSG